MAELHRESQHKGVGSFKAGAEAVAEEMEQLVVTFNAKKGEIVKVERVDKAGMHHELSEEECAKLAGHKELEEIEAALEDAFETGISVALGADDEDADYSEDDAEKAFRQLLIDGLLSRRPVRRQFLRRLLLGRLLRRQTGKRELRH